MKNEMKVQANTHAELRRRWAVRTHDELGKRCKKLDTDDLIEEFLSSCSLAVAIGDSGLGKSPLCYQMALCIAAGKPFLGRQVRQGRVLYLDYENGLDQVRGMVSSLGQYLGLEQIPDDLLLWNFKDSDSAGSESERLAMIRDFKPALAIVDSLTGFAPEIEDRNRIATNWYQDFREVIRDVGTSILGIHNLRKPSDHPKSKPDPLETANLRR